eukprot:NODE_2613_length_893_cov_80.917062_g2149_i0.p1 GENE.NODE_2613_length_893_cov_80.917062_g2149_i0~~NODE_2613_length_893_cov_80.917062_g2149_i0.p1  ORF type:complete len:195 (+),score=46.60 NODE_2613_length_893_cov_80.917062_g2149_i0:199-783(+)
MPLPSSSFSSVSLPLDPADSIVFNNKNMLEVQKHVSKFTAPNGKLGFIEFCRCLHDIGVNHQDQCVALFEMIGPEDGMFLSTDKLMSRLKALFSRHRRALLKNSFATWDLDHNEALELSEIRAVQHVRNHQTNVVKQSALMLDMFLQLDTNSDGSISYKEFTKCMRKSEMVMAFLPTLLRGLAMIRIKEIELES